MRAWRRRVPPCGAVWWTNIRFAPACAPGVVFSGANVSLIDGYDIGFVQLVRNWWRAARAARWVAPRLI